MPGPWIAAAVGVSLLLAVVLFAIVSYNRLVGLREAVRAAWAQIDVQLKRRHDLVPNLVETVKGYAAHERQALENVVAARNAAVGAGPADRAAAEAALGGALRQLFAVAEAYPDLKANANFLQLQAELANTENGVAGGRQGYNGLVAQYNAALLSFPANLVAGPFGFTPQPFVEVQDAGQREVPVVKF